MKVFFPLRSFHKEPFPSSWFSTSPNDPIPFSFWYIWVQLKILDQMIKEDFPVSLHPEVQSTSKFIRERRKIGTSDGIGFPASPFPLRSLTSNPYLSWVIKGQVMVVGILSLNPWGLIKCSFFYPFHLDPWQAIYIWTEWYRDKWW